MSFLFSSSRAVRGTFFVVLAGLLVGAMGCDSGGSGPGDPEDGPTAPSAVQATSQDGAVELTWEESADATGYNVYRSTSSDPDARGNPVNGDAPVGQPSYTDNGVENGTRYYYRVTAVGDGRESGTSSEVSARPFPSPPDRPEE